MYESPTTNTLIFFIFRCYRNIFLFDSFEGLPDLSKWEENTGWRPRTLKTSEEILVQNFKQNNLKIPIIHKDWFKDVPDYKIPENIFFR